MLSIEPPVANSGNVTVVTDPSATRGPAADAYERSSVGAACPEFLLEMHLLRRNRLGSAPGLHGALHSRRAEFSYLTREAREMGKGFYAGTTCAVRVASLRNLGPGLPQLTHAAGVDSRTGRDCASLRRVDLTLALRVFSPMADEAL